MQKLIVIYGCHGAGKTTLAKNILLSDGQNMTELSNKFGRYTVSENKKYVAVGTYQIKCGGADSLKSVADYFNMIDFLIQEYPTSIIIVEGIFLSALFNTPLKQFLNLKYEKNIDITMILLYTTVKSSFDRVVSRNNRIPKLKNIQAKQKSVVNTFSKFKQLQEFNTYIINTENKNSIEVYDEYRKTTIN